MGNDRATVWEHLPEKLVQNSTSTYRTILTPEVNHAPAVRKEAHDSLDHVALAELKLQAKTLRRV